MSQSKLSLKEAILININIMLGAGIFINTAPLAKNVGILSGFMYILNGALVLPLILSMAALMRVHPRGGFYTFGAQEIGSFAGFFSAWSYFVGKLASATLMIHTSLLLMQTIIPTLKTINIIALDLAVLAGFIGLNLLHMSVSMTVQSTAFILKLIPLFFAIISGVFLLSPGSWDAPHSINAFIQTMPLVLFTALGFEATLSLSNSIKNPDINGPRAIIIAFSTVVGICFFFQTCFYAALGETLAQAPNFLFAFPALITKMTSNPAMIYYASSFFHLAIVASALGGAYSILFSTHWNLYAIAQDNRILGARYFMQLNRYAMPTIGILLQGVVCFFYLFVTRGYQIPLQLIASFGCTISYTISVLSLWYAQRRNASSAPMWMTLFALCNCTIFITSGLYSLFTATLASFSLFAVMIAIGIGLFLIARRTNAPSGL